LPVKPKVKTGTLKLIKSSVLPIHPEKDAGMLARANFGYRRTELVSGGFSKALKVFIAGAVMLKSCILARKCSQTYL
jgi:hypothetical protein